MRVPPDIKLFAAQIGDKWGGYYPTRKDAVSAMATGEQKYRPSTSGAFIPPLSTESGGIGGTRYLRKYRAEMFWAEDPKTQPSQRTVAYPAKQRK